MALNMQAEIAQLESEAIFQFTQENYSKSYQLYKQILESDENNINALSGVARSLYELREPEHDQEALICLEKLISLISEEEDKELLLRNLRLKVDFLTEYDLDNVENQEKLEDAIVCSKEIIKYKKEDSRLIYNLALMCMSADRELDAYTYFYNFLLLVEAQDPDEADRVVIATNMESVLRIKLELERKQAQTVEAENPQRKIKPQAPDPEKLALINEMKEIARKVPQPSPLSFKYTFLNKPNTYGASPYHTPLLVRAEKGIVRQQEKTTVTAPVLVSKKSQGKMAAEQYRDATHLISPYKGAEGYSSFRPGAGVATGSGVFK